jgi:hypothetical protein
MKNAVSLTWCPNIGLWASRNNTKGNPGGKKVMGKPINLATSGGINPGMRARYEVVLILIMSASFFKRTASHYPVFVFLLSSCLFAVYSLAYQKGWVYITRGLQMRSSLKIASSAKIDWLLPPQQPRPYLWSVPRPILPLVISHHNHSVLFFGWAWGGPPIFQTVFWIVGAFVS